jgi:hypothetical protein
MGTRYGGGGGAELMCAVEVLHILGFTRSRNSSHDKSGEGLLFWLLYLTIPQLMEGVCQYKENQ